VPGDAPVRLRDLDACFQGDVPAAFATCSPEGVPNVTYLSVVHRLDDHHLALSFQFFNKSRQNVLAHPRAQLIVLEPRTFDQYRIDLRYLRTEESGPVFERMRVNLDAVASQTGMTGVFRLRGADIYQVFAIEPLAHDLDLSPPEAPADVVAALEDLSQRLAACDDLDRLLEETLHGLADLFDCPHSMILFTDASGARLFTVASRGFPASGVGAEIQVGDGLIGAAARERRSVRMQNLIVAQRMAEAVRSTAHERGHVLPDEIPLPGLADVRSQLAVPILARDRLLGVLCVQSAQGGRFTARDEQALSTLARHLATSILLVGSGAVAAEPVPCGAAGPPAAPGEVRIRHHAADDSVFLDDEYLIKGLPGRILVRLLAVHQQTGRVDFSNRELRADDSLGLSDYRDNLEARLILLRRRLEERTDTIRLVPTGRGRFRLEVRRRFQLLA
jgi:adenylate cyclase